MASEPKAQFLRMLNERYGPVRKMARSLSLFEVANGAVRVYIRYSKLHPRGRTFYGLRKQDLRQLQERPSVISFLWDTQAQPLLIPFSEYEEVFESTTPAEDGQYKSQVFLATEATELYVVRAGRFNVERHVGWENLDALIGKAHMPAVPPLSHAQIQTLLGAIGAARGQDVWIPLDNRERLDWTLTDRFACRNTLPNGLAQIEPILREVDVLWVRKGSGDIGALFEVEHSTPVYSGLLRFNDVHLAAPDERRSFSIVANDVRRSVFVKQLNRPTFKASGLSRICTFLEYSDVFAWHSRVRSGDR